MGLPPSLNCQLEGWQSIVIRFWRLGLGEGSEIYTRIHLYICCTASSNVCKQPVYNKMKINMIQLSDCHHSEMWTCDTSSISLQMSCGHFGHWWSSDLTFWCPAGIQWMSADIGAELVWHWTRNVSLTPHLNGGVVATDIDMTGHMWQMTVASVRVVLHSTYSASSSSCNQH